MDGWTPPPFVFLKKSGFQLDTLCLKTSSGSDFYKAQSCQKFDDQGVIFPITWDLGTQPGLFSDYLQMLLHHNKTLCFYSLQSLRAGVQHEHCRIYSGIFTSYNLGWDQLVTLLLLLQISSIEVIPAPVWTAWVRRWGPAAVQRCVKEERKMLFRGHHLVLALLTNYSKMPFFFTLFFLSVCGSVKTRNGHKKKLKLRLW